MQTMDPLLDSDEKDKVLVDEFHPYVRRLDKMIIHC